MHCSEAGINSWSLLTLPAKSPPLLQLRWQEPPETGGRPIQEYTAQMRQPGLIANQSPTEVSLEACFTPGDHQSAGLGILVDALV